MYDDPVIETYEDGRVVLGHGKEPHRGFLTIRQTDKHWDTYEQILELEGVFGRKWVVAL